MWDWFKKKHRDRNETPLSPESLPPAVVTATDAQAEGRVDQYFSDQPIMHKAQDRFNRAGFAARIAETLASRVDPSSIVIGLYGPWGDGKTSVLEMMQETLSQYKKITTVRFNPWHFQREEVLLRGFFATLAEAMGKSLPSKKEKVGELLEKYGSLLSLGTLTLGGLVEINPGDAAKNVGAALSNVGLDELRKRIEAFLDESGTRIVVLIDDIDRLDREETHAIFKLVKLSASFRHTSYVLAFDDNVVSAALGERYGAGGAAAGRAFLEKIVQVPLNLPPADEQSLFTLAMEGVEVSLNQAGIVLTQAQVDAFIRHFSDGLRPRLDTPRQAKLYTNALMFAVPLLKGEVSIVELMLVEGIRIFYPKLYAGIRDNPHLFMRSEERRERSDQGPNPLDVLLEQCMPNLSQTEREIVKSRLLVPLFPRVGNMGYGGEWEQIWEREQRICSANYFKRYFTYGIPIGDVSDAQITVFVTALALANDPEKRALLQPFAANSAIPRLISKCRQRAALLPLDQAKALATALAHSGDLLPRERGMMVMGGTMMQAAILIADLLRIVPAGTQRQEEAERIIRFATPLGFSVECFSWIRHYESRPDNERLLPDDGETPLQEILAARIEAENEQEPLYFSLQKDAKRLYWIWTDVRGKGVVHASLEARFTSSPEEVDQFLNCFVGEAWGMESGLPRPADFRRDDYNAATNLVPAMLIAANLRQRYGAQLDAPQQYPGDELSQALRVAHQFMRIHQHVIQPQNAPRGNADQNDDLASTD